MLDIVVSLLAKACARYPRNDYLISLQRSQCLVSADTDGHESVATLLHNAIPLWFLRALQSSRLSGQVSMRKVPAYETRLDVRGYASTRLCLPQWRDTG